MTRVVFFLAVLTSATPLAAEAPRAVPVTETVHGFTLTDEYRWMEDATNDAEMKTWVRAEALRAHAALAALPERAAFAQAISDSSSVLTRVLDVQSGGGTTVFRRSQTGDRVAKLIVVQNGAERVLIDPNNASGTSLASINNMSLSPDGSRIAVHQAKGGGEVGEIRIYDIATGQAVGNPIFNVWGESALTWLGGDAIAYSQMRQPGPGIDPVEGMRLFIAQISSDAAPVAVLGYGTTGSDLELKELPQISKAAASDWIVAFAGGARADTRVFLARRSNVVSGKPNWLNVAGLNDRVHAMDVLGNSAFALTTKTNGAGQVIKRSIGANGLGTEKLMFEGNDRLFLNDLAVAKDGVYALGQSDGVTRLFFSARGTAAFREVKLPFEGGGVAGFRPLVDNSGVSFGYSSWFQNLQNFTAVNGRVRNTGYGSSTWAGAKAFVADRMEAKSADGTMVPLVVLRKAGPIPTGGMPTILEAYGGYGRMRTAPRYGRDNMAWIAHGGAFALCGVRGGGERGRAWHEGGRGVNKPKGHEDFQSCAETLKTKGIATAAGPVAFGRSMAGTLVPPAVIKRPDLFAGLVSGVGVVNASRIGNAPNGANQFDEIGDPSKSDQYGGLVAMDAYQLLANAKALPPTLMTIGLNDRRVAPWMNAKFAARAQAKFGTDRVMLRADDDTGHGVGSAEEAVVAEDADIFAFAWRAASPKLAE